MTTEQIIQRQELAEALVRAAEIASRTQSEGWDTPARYIADMCKKWACEYHPRHKIIPRTPERQSLPFFEAANVAYDELQRVTWRQTNFQGLQVCYCENRLYALRRTVGTNNSNVWLVKAESEDAAIAFAVFNLKI